MPNNSNTQSEYEKTPAEPNDSAGASCFTEDLDADINIDDAEEMGGEEADSSAETSPDGEGNTDAEPVELALYQQLANHIIAASKTEKLARMSEFAAALEVEDSMIGDAILEMGADEEYADIRFIKGEQDSYYYSGKLITDNYANVIVLVEDQNIPNTVYTMVRKNTQLFKRPTAFNYFKRFPYHYDVAVMEETLSVMNADPRYPDIKKVNAYNGVPYLYNPDLMSEKYAKALADDNERGEDD